MKTEQQKEIETIKERTITIKLSDADCERVSNLCGEHNISVSYLLESFIGDLVNGTYTNGSDERDYARSYFERCWFGMYPEKSLLNFLLRMGYDVHGELISYVDDIEYCRNELVKYLDVPILYSEEIKQLNEEIADFEEQVNRIKKYYMEENPDADWDEEYEKVTKWWEETERLKGDYV